jgi:hypothetical protein
MGRVSLNGVEEIYDIQILPNILRPEIRDPTKWFELPSVEMPNGGFWLPRKDACRGGMIHRDARKPDGFQPIAQFRHRIDARDRGRGGGDDRQELSPPVRCRRA